MHPWAPFYAAVAAAAATLMGLLFVAVSVNAPATIGAGHGRSLRLSEQALQNYLTTVLVSLVALMPNISIRSFGIATFCMTVISGALTVWRFWVLAVGVKRGARVAFVRRYGSSLLGFGMLIASAVRMSLGVGDERSLFAISLLVLLGSATMVSWGLLLRIAQQEQAPQDEA
jgi:hypothetical protein